MNIDIDQIVRDLGTYPGNESSSKVYLESVRSELEGEIADSDLIDTLGISNIAFNEGYREGVTCRR